MSSSNLPTTTNEINASGLIYGTAGNDQINGSDSADTVYAAAGDDVVYGNGGNDIIYGQDGDDFLFGGDGTNALYGGNGDDYLYGGQGNDLLSGGPGDDFLFGGGGVNTGVFDELYHQTTITGSVNAQVVTGPDGTDTIYQIGVLQFLDGSLAYDTNSSIAQVYRLYQAAFGRTADTVGLTYWSNQIDSGTSLSKVAQSFLDSSEFTSRYTNASFVTDLYQNVLGRAPDSTGLAYWQGQLDSGLYTKANLLVSFSESTESVQNTSSVFNTGVFAVSNQALNVLGAYQAVLDRAPDAAGLAYWLDQVNSGLSVRDVVSNLLTSAEYQATLPSGGQTSSAFVQQVIQNTEGQADANGQNYWTGMLTAGATTQADVATAYATSSEMAVKVAPLVASGFAVAS